MGGMPAQEQAQHKIHAGLQLIDVARHARDERGHAEMVHLAVGQALDMAEQSGFQPGRKADGGLRREILRRDGADEADERQLVATWINKRSAAVASEGVA